MCGRYSLFTEEENQEIMHIVKSLNNRYPENTMKHGEIFPTNTAPILCLEENGIKPELSTWGFPRFGAKGVIINARSETADSRPMFKKSLHTRRCVVPSTGFYEWSQTGTKTKYRFNLPNDHTLYMAGIFNEFNGENKFVILTTNANNSIADVHNRMPVILKKEIAEDWIMSEEFALSYLHATMPVLQREVSA
ncbi:SOS response-associated peptidase [Faecalicatena orotica]|uniref:Abasic site processing protein n=1 Tax=Faecalicatena orotica TaxID=1544 RepID=A0A2Y9BGF2_9FIRM|nr:SOS response-associated peptidase [Faecalicatena orotica]PWJ28746.1 putative SOS response-associated peptidase YedK [Faecalicatena orotica]SSA56568.1 Putative SOS response-associated peptidase YedK [Faecalicatena orotica]